VTPAPAGPGPKGDGESDIQLVAETRCVFKRFGASQALKGVSIAIPTGDSRALVGRNGAGKSTLVSLLTGILAPDAGEVRLAGEPAPAPSERTKWRARVACVYQRSSVIPVLTVAENLFLNDHPTIGGHLISWAALRQKAHQLLNEWGLEVDVDRDAADLTVEQRQIVEIARALRLGTRFMILDEPTAQLEGREVARLFERIRHLQASGVTFLYISHHLEEIYEVCRSVTVLRDGEVVSNSPLSEMSKEALVAAMVGAAARQTVGRGHRRAGSQQTPRHVPALSVRRLRIDRSVDDVSLKIDVGECVGLAGLAGSGKEQVADAIAGILTPAFGDIQVAGVKLQPGQVGDARKKGVGYVPRDRHARGIVPQLSVAENLTLTIVEQLGQLGVIVPAERDHRARQLIGEFEIVVSSTEQPIAELSGGNQQKAVMGRALASKPKVLVLVSPTQGVDIASKEALFAMVEKARSAGTAVLVVSDDLDELIVCDRVLVIFKGRLIAEFTEDWQDAELVAAIEGVRGP
jgi:simple sugar transport system ATP-binding protein